MIEQVNGFITPMKGWDAVEKNDKKIIASSMISLHYPI